MNQERLCRYSDFFKAACRNGFQEQLTGEYRLPEEEPVVFHQFLVWMYTRTLDLVQPSNHWLRRDLFAKDAPATPGKKAAPGNEADVGYRSFMKLYFLGDRLQATMFKNELINGIIELQVSSDFVPCSDLTKLAYKNTPPSSTNPLRRLLVDMYVWDVEPDWLLANQADFTREFLVAVGVAALRIVGRLGSEGADTRAPYLVDVTRYHE